MCACRVRNVCLICAYRVPSCVPDVTCFSDRGPGAGGLSAQGEKNPYLANPNHMIRRKHPLVRLSSPRRHLDLFRTYDN